LIEIRGVTKSFGQPPTTVLHGIDAVIPEGSFVAITGRSGSGKSTLLYILSTLDQATSGSVLLGGRDPEKLTDSELHDFRNQNIGFVFQFHFLLPELTALENVLMPARKHRQHLNSQRRAYAMSLLERFDLKSKADQISTSLSGGEQQRVAIARALVMQPQYLFADEPTGNLDSINGEIVMRILEEASRERGATVLYVTHDRDFAGRADLQIQLKDGRIDQISRRSIDTAPAP
jgi:lipoprotein-releasing system ATP-binding protein